MSTTAPVPISAAGTPNPRPLLRPLALPTEHGGWGFLFEPIVLALLVAPSAGGTLLALAALAGFLTRQPLKYALQDALRRRSYPRTRYCRLFAAGYGSLALLLFVAAVRTSGAAIAVPFAAVAPLAAITLVYDAKNRSRAALPEFAGAAAMASTATAIALAGQARPAVAVALAGIVAARSLPAIAYVRTLLKRAHRQRASSWPALAFHAAAVGIVALFAPRMAVVAMALLAVRALVGLSRPPLPARTIGWSEIAMGAITVGLAAAAYL